MVTLQQAAQQALDLIEGNYVYLPEDRAYDTIAALRQALENEQQAEPVAWMFTVNGDEPRLHFFEPLAAHNVSDLKPLYTHPQQPLQADSVDSLTEGMTLGERIEHVGGRVNNSGYIEFGSTMAVDALIKQVLRDMWNRRTLPDSKTPNVGGNRLAPTQEQR